MSAGNLVHPFRALMLPPGLTPDQVITLQQVAARLTADALPALAQSGAGAEADVLMAVIDSVVALEPGACRAHRFAGTPGEVHARLLLVSAIAAAIADRIAVSFALLPTVALPVESRLGAEIVPLAASDRTNGLGIASDPLPPCDTEMR